ncbi:MAG: formate dehydrogenase subunit delta [Methylophilales bacterium]|jgi:formate dehydrogenase subunit delta|nr:formate dehydrogenase subunit delta [Pseudomonadota bacterium]NQW34754.1 formate dehydrogenase subunit delta [Methylophilales bacterium]HCK04463.1 formate dehydrogenase [Methylophilaceae bacterium]|tara:strand:+ start:23 stop:247 length:225 start_codon:yes stop_codon:yes gene_type:complete
MEKNNLITMANQIGAFFKSYPDKEQATKDIAGHLNKFWPPVMRKKIVEIISSEDFKSEEMNQMVLDAIKKYLKH